jgi:hypothetical protein
MPNPHYNPEDPLSILLNIGDVLSRNKFDGFWRGRVEYNKDPLQLGRCKVRVWEIHGPEYEKMPDGTARGSSIEALPWARAAFGMGGGGGAYDTGQFDVPPVGSNVWVFFERSEGDSPVYFGTYHDIAGQEVDPVEDEYLTADPPVDVVDDSPHQDYTVEDYYGRKYGTIYSQWREEELPVQPPSMGTWYRPPGPQMPLESQEMVDHDPTIHILFKTPKGATLLAEEADGKEKVEFLDRVGQGLRMEGFVTIEDNVGNAEQRGLRSVYRGDQLDRLKTLNEETRIMLADLINQGLLISSRKGEERVKLISNDETGKAALEAGLQRQELELNAGHKEFVYRGVVDGKTQTLIRAESSHGLITIDTDERVVVKTNKCIIDASSKGTTIYGNVTVHGDLSVTGQLRVIGPTFHIGHVIATSGCTGCVGFYGIL